MLIEIKGTGSHNKGAEMMLLTILQELRRRMPDAKYTVAPEYGVCEYGFYSRLQLYPKAWLQYRNIQFAPLAGLIPARVRKAFGLVLDRETDAVLDASGFAYSDQWGTRPTQLMAGYVESWRKQGKKIILLPQAFGPFKSDANVRNMRRIITASNLIYARDQISLQALKAIAPGQEKIHLAPDFTVLFEGVVPEYYNREKHRICIVPNTRMLDKTGSAGDYIALIRKGITYFQDHGMTPFFLIHGGEEDLRLADEINRQLSSTIEIVNESDPYLIKGMIKSAAGVFGSRFHSLASALYSGTVAIGTGWSHKYEQLFKGFSFADGLLDLKTDDDVLYRRLDLIVKPELRDAASRKLSDFSAPLRQEATLMFDEICRTLTEK